MICSMCGLEEGSDRPGSRECKVCEATLPYEIRITNDIQRGGWILVREDVGAEPYGKVQRIGFWQRKADGTVVASVHRPFNQTWHERATGRSTRRTIATVLQQAGYR